MAEAPDKLDLILMALQGLSTDVGALAERVAEIEAGASSAPAFEPFTMTNTHSFEPLVPLDDDNELPRYKMCKAIGILGTPAGEAYMAGGARGFYRGLDRDEGQERLRIPRGVALALVEEAGLEDAQEAIDMGADLLKVWPEEDEGIDSGLGIGIETKGGAVAASTIGVAMPT